MYRFPSWVNICWPETIMNTKKYLKYSILPRCALMLVAWHSACRRHRGGKPVDEAYDAVKRVDSMLLDVTSNKNESVIELRSDKHQTESSSALRKRRRRVST